MSKFKAAVGRTIKAIFSELGFKVACIAVFLVGVAATLRAGQEDFLYWSQYGRAEVALIFQAAVFGLVCLAACLLRRKRRAWGWSLYAVAMCFAAFNMVSLVGFGASARIAPVEAAKLDQQRAIDGAVEVADATNASLNSTRASLQRSIDAATCTMKDRVRRAACLESRKALIASLVALPAPVAAALPKTDAKAIDAQAEALKRVQPAWLGLSAEDIAVAIVIAQSLLLLLLSKIFPPIGIYFYPERKGAGEIARLEVTANDNVPLPAVLPETPALPPVLPEPEPLLNALPEPEPAAEVVNEVAARAAGRAEAVRRMKDIAANTDAHVERVFKAAFRSIKTQTAPWSAELVYQQYRKVAKELGEQVLSRRTFHTTVQRLVDLKLVRVARLDDNDGKLTYFGIAPVFDVDEIVPHVRVGALEKKAA